MNDQEISERAMRYLNEVATRGGVRAAADALGVNPSVISRQIAMLERVIRIPLLARQGRTVEVTEVGRILVEFHRDQRRRTRQLQAQLAEYRDLERGRIAIGVGEGFVEGLVTGALRRFSVKHPHIAIDLRSGSTSDIAAMVRDDVVDIGLCVGVAREPGCNVRAFPAGPLCAVMTPAHPLASFRKVPLAELARHQLIFMASQFAVQEHLQAMFDAEGLTLVPTYRCDLFSAAQALAAAGLGVAFMSASAARGRIEQGQLVATPLDHPIARAFGSQLMRRTGRRLSPASEHLWKQLIRGASAA
jgi:DNA-binding transcriptional LysR family regulator